MIKALTASFLMLGVALQSSAALAKKPKLFIDLSVTADGTCLAHIGAENLTITQAALDAKLPEAAPDKATQITLRGPQDLPYRCVGPVVFALQRLRYEAISFAEDAPPLGPDVTRPPPAQ